MGDWSVTCGPYSLLGCIRVLTFIRLNRLIRIAFLASFSEEVIARVALGPAASTSFGASLTSEQGGGSIFLDGKGIIHAFCHPLVGRGFNPSLFKSLVPNLGIVKLAYPRNLSL